MLVLAVAPAAASAAPLPELLWQTPGSGAQESGSAAGQLDNPMGVAASPLNGNVYVSDRRNQRVSQFTVWGEFVKAWGWGVADGTTAALQTCGPEATPPTGSCFKGIEGEGAGQFRGPSGIALDSAGNVYVVDQGNQRVQKFSPTGEFLLTFGGEVNKTTNANLCPVASGDSCGAGTVGAANGQFGNLNPYAPIAVGPGDVVYVGDEKRVQEFEPDGSFKGEVKLGSGTVRSLAVDDAGNLYVVLAGAESVSKLSPEGALLRTFGAEVPEAIALDDAGSLYVADGATSGSQREVLEFAPDGTVLIGPGSGFVRYEGLVSFGGFSLQGLGTSSACNLGADHLYVSAYNGDSSFVSANGPPPDPAVCPPPVKPPTISDQYAVSVDPDSAVVRAKINPHFWPDTTYRVEYGTGKCSEGGCGQTQPVSAAKLGDKVIDALLSSAGVALPNLAPQTPYHYRFVAQSSGGGPTVGVGAGEAEATFTTPALPSPANANCPNQVFRNGASSFLPDCRAYEMVSPVDKGNGDVLALCNTVCDPAGLDQSAGEGGRFTYSSFRSFGDAVSSPYTSQYLATRGEGGWSSRGISATRGLNILTLGNTLESEFRAFSTDLCSGWIMHDSDPLAPGAPAGYANLYQRHSCDGGTYTTLITGEPQEQPPVLFVPELQGYTEDGCAVFQVEDRLTADAATGNAYQLYESCNGELDLVSVLPNGTANKTNGSAGTSNSIVKIRTASVEHAVAEDGSRIYWSASAGESAPGKLFVRENPDRPQSEVLGGECTEAGQACTKAVSGLVSNEPAQFFTAAADGSRAIFSILAGPLQENLYEYDAQAGETRLIAKTVKGLLGASENASHLYLVATQALAPGASAGKPNVYLYRAGSEGKTGSFAFVAPFSAQDANPISFYPSPINREPVRHTARVSPDGQHLAFVSNSKALSELSAGYDNSDVNSGEPVAEVYVYDAAANAGTGELDCASCNPTGARPAGVNIGGGLNPLIAAAHIPTWESQLYAPRALSDDGARLFFNSFDALVTTDTNGRQDVYQWEAPGSGNCSAQSTAYSASAGGCVSLISSGESPQDSEFVDASQSGADVFIRTSANLLPQDPGLIDVYDARVNGGFPPLPPPRPGCEGGSCQNPPAPPSDPTPASAGFHGPGDAKAKAKKKAHKKKKAQHKKKQRQKQKQAKRKGARE